jgi:integrase
MRTPPGIRRVGPRRYEIRATISDPTTGKRKDTARIIQKENLSEVIAAQMALQQELIRSDTPARATVSEYADVWLARRAPRLKHSTMLRYKEHLNRIVADLGSVYMDKLTPGMVTDWLQVHARTMSGWTCHGALRVLRTMTRDAQVDLGLSRWPCERVVPPKALNRYDEDDPNALTGEELGRLFVAMQDHEPYWLPLFAAMAFTGQRFAEASALKWSDIDFEAGTIAVRRSQYRGVVGDTKTEASRRRIPLVAELASVLRNHREKLLREQHPGLAAEWVFPSNVGGLLSTGCLNDPIRRACARVGIKHRLTAHGLRRTLNTLALQVTSSETTRKILGHATSAMTAHYNAPAMAEKRAVLGG